MDDDFFPFAVGTPVAYYKNVFEGSGLAEERLGADPSGEHGGGPTGSLRHAEQVQAFMVPPCSQNMASRLNPGRHWPGLYRGQVLLPVIRNPRHRPDAGFSFAVALPDTSGSARVVNSWAMR
jgi:hypothetical protein